MCRTTCRAIASEQDTVRRAACTGEKRTASRVTAVRYPKYTPAREKKNRCTAAPDGRMPTTSSATPAPMPNELLVSTSPATADPFRGGPLWGASPRMSRLPKRQRPAPMSSPMTRAAVPNSNRVSSRSRVSELYSMLSTVPVKPRSSSSVARYDRCSSLPVSRTDAKRLKPCDSIGVAAADVSSSRRASANNLSRSMVAAT